MSKSNQPKAPQFRKTKLVTVPVMKIDFDKPYYVRLDSPFYLGKEIKEKSGKPSKKPATLVNVTNMETGDLGIIVCNEVLKSTIEEGYPENSYQGKIFEIIKHPKKEGKEYCTFSIAECEAA